MFLEEALDRGGDELETEFGGDANIVTVVRENRE